MKHQRVPKPVKNCESLKPLFPATPSQSHVRCKKQRKTEQKTQEGADTTVQQKSATVTVD